jgi:hypothetical protein
VQKLGVKMEISAKIKDFLLALTSAAIILIVIIAWWIKPQKSFVFPQKYLPKKRMERIVVVPQGPGPSYNYSQILSLLRQYRKFELGFYSDFENFSRDPENIKIMQKTLNDLKTEKEYFHKHLQKMNTFYKRAMPSKKCNALRYHLRSVERAIDELEDILKKIKLNKV